MGIFFVVFSSSLSAQLLQKEEVFQEGEKISYTIFYNWGFIWVEAGEVTFSVDSTHYHGKKVLAFTGVGKTKKKWDWMYKVRDTYESHTETDNNLSPIHFHRDVLEGKVRIDNEYEFYPEQKQVVFTDHLHEDVTDTLNYSSGVHDVITMIYKARLFDYDSYSKGDKIPIQIILDGKIYSTYIRYLGVERIEVEDKGFITCYKFKPLLIEGTIFSAGEEMTVWVTHDKSRIPILVETPILVGSIKVYLTSATNILRPIEFDPEE